ncbi:2Fe-2S iron-sulfur cluster-binding protein [Mariprofundus sp. KV]|uniref:2Fe-2S iron-sulfur cluster-binding protein n=1 Tax=Mariprofundus sp. KV TaxID=2608715 RepID=UPI0015A08ED6|nr:2Fe-2S iron-sulfur cluster-binding protein [Mariprofundus sp. KV]NWF37440.1 2Fe-2S iron-sulfur cluster binding domain-containing protein [Mariprofundus sp. KV]
MPTITYQGNSYECSSEQTLLDGVNSQGANLPYGCRSGLCQGCLVKAVKGIPPASAQMGIKPTLKEKGYFLSCLCKPESDLEISRPDRRDEYIPVTVSKIEQLNPSIIRLVTTSPDNFSYKPGQFVNIIRSGDGLARSYSLASVPDDGQLEFHIRLLPDGKMSGWIANELKSGDELLLSEAMGDCCYRNAYADRPLLLAGTGTGLAPLYGILRDALSFGHRREITLLHGGLSSDDLYLHTALSELAAEHDNLSYIPCVLHGEAPENGLSGSIDTLIPAQLGSGDDWAAFLCGDAAIVTAMRRNCFRHGVDENSIHSDTFG